MVPSTTAAGSINQTARGLVSLLAKSFSEDDPTAFSCTNSSTDFGDISKTTHSWPAFMSRRTMLAPRTDRCHPAGGAGRPRFALQSSQQATYPGEPRARSDRGTEVAGGWLAARRAACVEIGRAH